MQIKYRCRDFGLCGASAIGSASEAGRIKILGQNVGFGGRWYNVCSGIAHQNSSGIRPVHTLRDPCAEESDPADRVCMTWTFTKSTTIMEAVDTTL